jgi:hypothetical protein
MTDDPQSWKEELFRLLNTSPHEQLLQTIALDLLPVANTILYWALVLQEAETKEQREGATQNIIRHTSHVKEIIETILDYYRDQRGKR